MNEADQHLLQLIGEGDDEGWRQFVQRFQGRLVAFASRQVGSSDTAEDLVQETFVSFLRSAQSYRGDCELESFLFQILRRRVVDHFRRLGRNREIAVCTMGASESSTIDPLDPDRPSHDLQAELDNVSMGLSHAVSELASRLRAQRKFRDLKIAEGVFFAGRSNREIATLIDVSANEVAVVKRRLIARLAEHLSSLIRVEETDLGDTPLAADLLSRVWQSQRPSCPKRTTLGKYTLGILPQDWNAFVAFHLETLGCVFCQANVDELALDDTGPPAPDDRLFQSTIGFFRSKG